MTMRGYKLFEKKRRVLRGKIRIKYFDWEFIAAVLIWILAHAQRHHRHADNSRISRPDNVLASMTMCKFWRPANIEYYSKYIHTIQGRIQDFMLEGTHLKKLRRAEGGANIWGVFRVKNHDFTPTNHIFFKF